MIKSTLKQTIIYSFVGGIFTGLGLTVGIAIVGYILSFFASHVVTLPLVGDFLANIIKATLEALKNK